MTFNSVPFLGTLGTNGWGHFPYSKDAFLSGFIAFLTDINLLFHYQLAIRQFLKVA